MPKFYGFKNHDHGRWFRFSTKHTGFIHTFDSASDRNTWAASPDAASANERSALLGNELVSDETGDPTTLILVEDAASAEHAPKH